MEVIIAKADRVIISDAMEAFEALPASAKEYVVQYGLKQALNDACASVDKSEPDNAFALALRKWEKIKSGDLSARAGGGRVGDPVKAEAIRSALDTVKGKWRKAGRKADAKPMLAEAKRLVAENPAYMHLAEKHVDERKALGLEIDDSILDELEPNE